jgi:transcriptional regulator with XRE-family HTH domain
MKTKETPPTLGQKLKRLRREKNWSQTEVADKLGTTLVTISSYENDKTKPSSDMLIKFTKLFSVSVDYLISNQTASSALQIRNKELQKRIEVLDRMNPEQLKSLIDMMDLVIRDHQVKELSRAS